MISVIAFLRPCAAHQPKIDLRQLSPDLVQIANRDAAVAVAPDQLSAIGTELNQYGRRAGVDGDLEHGSISFAARGSHR